MGQTSLESLAVVDDDDVGSERDASFMGDFYLSLRVFKDVTLSVLVNVERPNRVGWLEPLSRKSEFHGASSLTGSSMKCSHFSGVRSMLWSASGVPIDG
jgi:hypothetical protein